MFLVVGPSPPMGQEIQNARDIDAHGYKQEPNNGFLPKQGFFDLGNVEMDPDTTSNVPDLVALFIVTRQTNFFCK